MLCNRAVKATDVPSDAITTWKDGDGVNFYLQPQKIRQPIPEYNPANGPLIPRHFSSAIFELGCDILIKVKYAPIGWSRREGRSMNLIRERAPSVPIPEVIHFWVDEELKRYFLIMRRVHGKLIDDVYFSFSKAQVAAVMDELGSHVKAVADITAPCFQDVDGKPVVDSYVLDYKIETATGAWAPILDKFPGPFTVDEFRIEMQKVSGALEPPEMDSEFHFYHRDMGPTNVIVEETDELLLNGEKKWRIAGIIDWEMAAFYPKFFITCHIRHSPGHYDITLPDGLNLPSNYRNHYSMMLNRGLQHAGLQSGDQYKSWYSNHITALMG